MKLPIFGSLALMFFVNAAHAELITMGTSIASARKALVAGRYAETGLEVIPKTKDTALDFWAVDEGVLILSHSTLPNMEGGITGLSYRLMDERPKSTRMTFDFAVESFDTTTGKLILNTKKPVPPAKSAPELGKNGDSPNPVTAFLTGARDFRTWDNRVLPKAAGDEVVGVLNRFAGSFTPTEHDCRMPEKGPMLTLAPAHVVSFTNAANETVSVVLFVFSKEYSVIQAEVLSKPNQFFQSTNKELLAHFAEIIRKEAKASGK